MKRLIILSLGLLATKSAFAAEGKSLQPSAPKPCVLEFPLTSLIRLHQDELITMRGFLRSTINNEDAADNLSGVHRERAEKLMEETYEIIQEASDKKVSANQKKEQMPFLKDHEWSSYETNRDIVLRLFVKHLNAKMPKLTDKVNALVATITV